jgi:hypothetical protein
MMSNKRANTYAEQIFLRLELRRRGGAWLPNGSEVLRRIRSDLQREFGDRITIPTNLFHLSMKAGLNTPKQKLLLYKKFYEFGGGKEGGGTEQENHKALVKRLQEDTELNSRGVEVPSDWKSLMQLLRPWGSRKYVMEQARAKAQLSVLPKCTDCGKKILGSNSFGDKDHITCSDCSAKTECDVCGENTHCTENLCDHLVCDDCSTDCYRCSGAVCTECVGQCQDCDDGFCSGCLRRDGRCRPCAGENDQVARNERMYDDGNQYEEY